MNNVKPILRCFHLKPILTILIFWICVTISVSVYIHNTQTKVTQHKSMVIEVSTLRSTQQECIPAGCVPPVSMVISTGGGGVCLVKCLPGWCLPRGWMTEGCLPRVYLPKRGNVCPGGCTPPDPESDSPWTQRQTHPRHPRDPEADTPLMNRMTDRCKNITFPQLRLRAVIWMFCNGQLWIL